MKRILEFMSKDHERLESIFKQFQSSKKDQDSATRFFHDFKAGLERHIVWEEEILFEYLETKQKSLRTSMNISNPIALLRMQHTQIKDYLDKIHKSIENMNIATDDLEAWLTEILDDHNIQEEEIVYPWIDEELSEEEINEAFEKMNNITEERCC